MCKLFQIVDASAITIYSNPTPPPRKIGHCATHRRYLKSLDIYSLSNLEIVEHHQNRPASRAVFCIINKVIEELDVYIPEVYGSW